MKNLFWALAGLCSILFGLSIIIEPKFYDKLYSTYWDFTDIKWPLGFVCILYGLYLIFLAGRRFINK